MITHPSSTLVRDSLFRFSVAVASLACATCFAAYTTNTWTGSGADDNWGTGGNWDDGEPETSHKALIDNGDTVTLDSTGEVAYWIEVNGDSTVRQTGGRIDMQDGERTAGSPYRTIEPFLITGGGRYELQGGTLTNDGGGGTTSTGSPQLYMHVGDGGVGTFVQSGGVFGDQNPRSGLEGFYTVQVGLDTDGDGTLRFEGDGAFYINWDISDLNIGDGTGEGRLEVSGSDITAIEIGQELRLASTSTTRFELDAGGVTPVSVGTRAKTYNDNYSALHLDGELEIALLAEPPESNITLIDLSGLGSEPTSVNGTFDGLSEGDVVESIFDQTTYAWTLTYAGGDGDDVVLTDMTIIPEPASAALAVLAVLAAVCRRGRR